MSRIERTTVNTPVYVRMTVEPPIEKIQPLPRVRTVGLEKSRRWVPKEQLGRILQENGCADGGDQRYQSRVPVKAGKRFFRRK